MNKCSAITNAGGRCKAIAITGSDYCNAHHPDRVEARKRSTSRAGRAGGRGRPKARLDSIYAFAQDQLQGLFDRSVDPRRSAVAVQWCNLQVKCLEQERKLVDQQELEQKVEELERMYRYRREDTAGPFDVGGYS